MISVYIYGAQDLPLIITLLPPKMLLCGKKIHILDLRFGQKYNIKTIKIAFKVTSKCLLVIQSENWVQFVQIFCRCHKNLWYQCNIEWSRMYIMLHFHGSRNRYTRSINNQYSVYLSSHLHLYFCVFALFEKWLKKLRK